MPANVAPETIVATLAAQGVASNPARAEPYAQFTTTVLNASAAAYSQLAFEQEPAGFTLELRKAAP